MTATTARPNPDDPNRTHNEDRDPARAGLPEPRRSAPPSSREPGRINRGDPPGGRGRGHRRRRGMTGSPTLLIDGTDPFARPGSEPSLSCRLYPSENGRVEGAPSVDDLRRVLAIHQQC